MEANSYVHHKYFLLLKYLAIPVVNNEKVFVQYKMLTYISNDIHWRQHTLFRVQKQTMKQEDSLHHSFIGFVLFSVCLAPFIYEM